MNEWSGLCPQCNSDEYEAIYESANNQTVVFKCGSCDEEFHVKWERKYYLRQ